MTHPDIGADEMRIGLLTLKNLVRNGLLNVWLSSECMTANVNARNILFLLLSDRPSAFTELNVCTISDAAISSIDIRCDSVDMLINSDRSRALKNPISKQNLANFSPYNAVSASFATIISSWAKKQKSHSSLASRSSNWLACNIIKFTFKFSFFFVLFFAF